MQYCSGGVGPLGTRHCDKVLLADKHAPPDASDIVEPSTKPDGDWDSDDEAEGWQGEDEDEDEEEDEDEDEEEDEDKEEDEEEEEDEEDESRELMYDSKRPK
jgi:hypothetical protein